MHRITQLLLLIFISSVIAQARTNIQPTGASAAAMGNAQVAGSDCWSVVYNQAGLALIENYVVSLYYENKFLVDEFAVNSIVATIPTRAGSFGFMYSTFGPSIWQETNAKIAYGKQLSDKMLAGIAINYFGSKLPEDNALLFAMSFDIGVSWLANEKTSFGVHLSNPYVPELKSYFFTEEIPWKITAGGQTRFVDRFLLAYELEIIEDERPSVKCGAEWEAIKSVYIRAGVNSYTKRFSTGLGYQFKFIKADIAFAYHQYLGYSPSISIELELP